MKKMFAIMCLIGIALLCAIFTMPAGSGQYWAIIPMMALLVAFALAASSAMSDKD